MNELIIKGYKDIDTWSTKWDAEVIKQKQNVLSTYYDTPDVQETATQAIDMYDEAEKGTFGGNTNLQEIYTSLPQNEKEAYLEKVESWAKEVRDNIKAKEDARVADATGIIKDTRVKYYEAKLDGDYVAAKQHLDAMKNVDKDEYEKLIKDFDTSIDDGAFTDADEYDKLETLLIRDQLTDIDVDNAYSKRKITSKQRSEFKLAIDKRKTATFTKADAYMKKAIGYEDTRISIGDSDEKNMAFERYRIKSNELYDYMINNPGISSGELMAKAKEIVADRQVDADITVKINTLRTKISSNNKAYGGFSLMNNEFLKYMRAHDETIKTMNDFSTNYFGSAENMDKLIVALRSIQKIPEGGSIKVDVPGKWFDDEVKRPFNINDDNLDIIIADVKALKELYNQQGGN
jgi:hypothetical protein